MMVSWNVMNLLHRFGKPLENYDGDGEGAGVALGIKACAKLYKRMFGSNLLASPLLNLGMSVVMLYLSSHGSGYSDYDKSAFVLYGNFKYI